MDTSTISMLFFIIPLLLKFYIPELGITKSNTSRSASGGSRSASGGSSRGCVVSRCRRTTLITTTGDNGETKKEY